MDQKILPRSAAGTSGAAGQFRTYPLRWVLAGIFGSITLVTAIAILWLGLGVAFKNTGQLLRDKADLYLEMITTRLDQHMAPARNLPVFIGRKIADGTIDVRDPEALRTALTFGFAAAPQLSAAVYVDMSGWYLSVFKERDGDVGIELDQWADNEPVAKQMKRLPLAPKDRIFWGEPIYSKGAGTTLIFMGYPVYVDGVLKGAAIATIRMEELATFVSSLDDTVQGHAFILYNHERVLAHPLLTNPEGMVSEERPLLTIEQLGDPVLRGFRSEGWEDRQIAPGVNGHWSEVDDQGYVYLYKNLGDVEPMTWTAAIYFQEDAVDEEIDRLQGASMMALAAVAFSIIICLLIAKRMARPAMQIASAARKVSRLELDDIGDLPRSRVKEPNEITQAFGSMVQALRFFARYVPRDLVRRLIDAGEVPKSEERLLTVMFTDIRGFTSLSSQLGPAETANFLNQHFEMLCEPIVENGGTIDKYMGDGAMAFWGAPEPMDDQAERAVRAAIDIKSRIEAQNVEAGEPIAIRIGIASGKIIVGDIGSSARMNYTVVGNAVNVAQRLESLGRDLLPDHDVAILIDEMTARQLPEGIMHSLGHHNLRGLNQTVEIFGLADADAD